MVTIAGASVGSDHTMRHKRKKRRSTHGERPPRTQDEAKHPMIWAVGAFLIPFLTLTPIHAAFYRLAGGQF